PATARVHQSTDLHLIAPVQRSGVPTTPIERTLLDLGAVVPPTRVQLALDHALRAGLTTIDRLLGTLVRHARRGRRGVRPLRELLAEQLEQGSTPDSGLERLVVILLREAGLPRPTLQHPVTIGGHAYRTDLCYPEARVAIEPDGSIHLRRDVWQSDHERQNALVLAGWTILRFTWGDYRRHPERIVREVERALAMGAVGR
ncbi:MAG: endonuclease domain-containing protein, partial [Acidimicrobiia bacterium]